MTNLLTRLALTFCVFGTAFSNVLMSGETEERVDQVPQDVVEPANAPEIEAGHSFHGEAFDEGPRQAAYLMSGMGNVHWKVSTKVPMAQRFFDQGIAQMHGFWYFEAERSFRQVAAFDPDCAMAYWGMARANTKNEKRARGFIEQAIQKKDKASDWERRLIEALNTQLQEKVDGKPVLKKKRMENYAKTLEEISLDFPEEIELKALLVLQTWENEKEGLPVQSRRALDAMLTEIFTKNPRHPAHHFRIHLWDNSRRALAVASAAECGPALPGIAHMWHMPGHTYSGLQRYHDAAWQQEASARVDHAHMIRDRVMPDQIHNFAHNNEWLIRTWIKTGESDKALALAKNMCELPRHPKYNTIDKGSAMFGRSRLYSILTTFGLWDAMESIAHTPYLEATDVSAKQDERLAWLAVAQWMTGKREQASANQNELRERLGSAKAEYAKITAELRSIDSSKPPTKPKSTSSTRTNSTVSMIRPPSLDTPIELDPYDWDEVAKKKENTSEREPAWNEEATKSWTKPQQARAKEHAKVKARIDKLKPFVALVEAYRAAAENRFGEAISWARQAGTIVPAFDRIEWYQRDGRPHTALAKVREKIKSSKGEVLPLAVGAWIAWQAGDQKQTREWLKELSVISFAADPHLPQMIRLNPILQKLDLTSDFGKKPKPPKDLGVRPPLDSLGPQHWSPYRAPSWSLIDSKGTLIASKQYQDKPTVMIFYLGFGCLHCVEQLQAFSPMVERYKKAGFEMIAISTENLESLQKSLKNYTEPIEIPLLANPELDLFKEMRCYDDFENQPLHGTFAVDRHGRVIWQDIGPEPFKDAEFLLREITRLDSLDRLNHLK